MIAPAFIVASTDGTARGYDDTGALRCGPAAPEAMKLVFPNAIYIGVREEPPQVDTVKHLNAAWTK